MNGRLAGSARFELEQRRARYPDAIAQGRLDQAEGAADLAAWAAIDELLRTGNCDATALEAIAGETSMPSAWWRILEQAATKAVTARAAAADARPADEARAVRWRDAQAVHALIRRNLDLCSLGRLTESAEAA
ncbi:MAG: hypothetical protein ACXW27_08650 [Allosphingosinicella sp.]